MALDDTIKTLNIEKELALGNAKEVDESTLRCTRGLLPFVLSVLEEVGAPIPTPLQVQAAFFQYGERGPAGEVYIPQQVSAEFLPGHFPTLQRLRESPDQYFFKPVGIYNAELSDNVQFSLLRTEDRRVLIRCHYDLTQRRNIP